MIKEAGEYFTLEWSPTHKCFHIQVLDDLLRQNMAMTLQSSHSDYRVIAMFDNPQAADDFADSLRRDYPDIFGHLDLSD